MIYSPFFLFNIIKSITIITWTIYYLVTLKLEIKNLYWIDILDSFQDNNFKSDINKKKYIIIMRQYFLIEQNL